MLHLMLALTLAGNSSPGPNLPGVWSVGETRNCETGEAWVFTADGYYVEVDLPSSPIKAVGKWSDTGKEIRYTHAHMPFPGHEKPMTQRAYTIVERTAHRIIARNYKGESRAFHRCPANSLKGEH